MRSLIQIKKSLKRLLSEVLDFLFPPICLSCSKHVGEWGQFCNTCWSNLVFIEKPLCKQCGSPFDFKIEDDTLCGKCIQTKPHYDRVRSIFLYNDVSKKIILNLKSYDSTHLALYMAKYIKKAPDDLLSNADIIAPVPLHWKRLLKRKFNQSSLILQHLDIDADKKYYDLLYRKKNTPIQGNMNEEKRIENTKSAFRVTEAYLSAIKGKNILLIDDVFTTGATINECAKTLKKQGAKEVWCLSFARTKQYPQSSLLN